MILKFIEWLYSDTKEEYKGKEGPVRCPYCESENISKYKDKYVCNDCGLEFKGD